MIVLALASMFAQVTPPSAEAVLGKFESLLGGFGVKGPMRIQAVWIGDGSPNTVGSVVVSDRSGTRYTGYLRPGTFALYAMFRGKESEDYMGYPTTDVHDKAILKRLSEYGARAYGRESVRMESARSDGKKVLVFFAILRRGFPFVAASQPYGYSLTFTMPDLRFLFFMADSPPPPVDTRNPKLSESDAVEAFRRIFEGEMAPRAIADHHWSISYRLQPGRKLGWYLPKGESVARLVWNIPYIGTRHTEFADQGGSAGMLIDAITGKQVPTETVP
ncbi:MAG: hypothetical protein P4L46_20300 [Fimbriimonas sp.]|nr:hypothetical protein [Fimbriimonas sp.]